MHALPGQLTGVGIVDLGPLLIEEAMRRRIAEQLVLYALGLERRFEGIHGLWRAPIVLVGEVAL